MRRGFVFRRALSRQFSSGPSGGGKGSDGWQGYNRNKPVSAVVTLVGMVAVLEYLRRRKMDAAQPEITWQSFKSDFLLRDNVGRLDVIDETRVNVYTKGAVSPSAYFKIPSIDTFERNMDETQYEMGRSVFEYVPVWHTRTSTVFVDLLQLLAPTLLLLGGIWFMNTRMRGGAGGGGMFGVAKSKAKLINKETGLKTTFNDVAGLLEAKQEVMEFVEFLKNPAKYEALGARIPKGALLVGPPGTGKTLLAKATAGEAGVPFFSISGSDFMEMFVGVGPARVRDLFKQARESAPSIVWIDEIDAVGRARSAIGGGNDERENTLNQLLVEMDGFEASKGVVVLAGTNRADILDKALLRPGRFDRQITVDLPDIMGRRDIFDVHLRGIKLAPGQTEVTSKKLATLTPGMSGADIANVCNEAALIAARQGKEFVDAKDFEAAIERIVGGIEKKNKVIAPDEKAKIAYHEAGHAIVGWFLEHCVPLLKVSIVPRGSDALGYAQYLPREQYLYTTQQMLDNMCMTLGGRVAEQIKFGEISTGAQDDLQKITRQVYAQITRYGMCPALGNVAFADVDESSGNYQKPYSEKTAKLIDSEARRMVSEAYKRTEDLLRSKMAQLEQVAQRLLEKEVLKTEDLVEILGERPFGMTKTSYETLAEKLIQEAEAKVRHHKDRKD